MGVIDDLKAKLTAKRPPSTAAKIRQAGSLEQLESLMTHAVGYGNTKTRRRIEAAYRAAKARLAGAKA